MAFSLAVYGPTGTKLGRKMYGQWEELDRPLVSMVTIMLLWKLEKNCHGQDIGPRLLNFCMWANVDHVNPPAKNERNLPHHFRAGNMDGN